MRPAIIATLGFFLMLWNLGIPSLWQDEAATIAASNRSLPALFRLLGNIDAVHGTYYVFIHFWGQAFGLTPFALRVPSAIAVAASAYLLYRLALRLELGGPTAAWASIIFLTLPRTHMAGSEARSNAFTATLAIALTLTLVTALQKGNRKSWLIYSLVGAVSIYMFMFSALILVPFGIYVAIKKREQIRTFILSTGLSLTVSAPVFYFGYAERGQVGWISKKPIYEYLWESLIAVDYNRAWPMAILGLLLCLVAILRGTPLLLTLWATVPSATLITISLVSTPYFVDHYLTFTTGATAILIAIGLQKILPVGRRSALVKSAVGLLIVVLSLPSFIQSREPIAKGTEWASIAAAIQQNSHAGDAILLPDAVSKTSRALDLMMVAYAPEFAGRIDLTLTDDGVIRGQIFGSRIRESQALEPQSHRVLVIRDTKGNSTNASATPTWLTENFAETKTIRFDSALVAVFDRK